MSESTSAAESSAGVASQVASHYNTVPETGRVVRQQSRIFHLRNFNNWTKSVLINEAMRMLRDENRGGRVTVLDLCCGKGGDLLKWNKARIDHLICVDIAGTSVEQCRSRHEENMRKNHRTYSAEFHVADCTRKRLKDLYKNRDVQLDLVSCQFSFHYCFESYDQAMTMLGNVSESLKPGGLFICTTLNSNELVKRWRQSDTNEFGNDVFRVSFESEDKKNIPLFGAQYKFYLEGSVMDCPEFLVHFPLLMKLAEQHGLELVYRKPFEDFFNEYSTKPEHKSLLWRMNALEPYPATEPVSTLPEDYVHVLCDDMDRNDTSRPKYGTLTKAEWEVVTVYLACVFRKKVVE